MGDLEYLKNRESMPAVSYDPAEKVFHFGSKSMELQPSLGEIFPGTFTLSVPAENDIETAPIVFGLFGNPVGTRRFHRWLEELTADEKGFLKTRQKTLEIMRSVMVELWPGAEIPKTEGGVWGFDFGTDANSHAHLRVFGDCACLTPLADGGSDVDSRAWDEGLCEYGYHNTDRYPQAWGLLAGLGHLALLASEK